MSDVVAPGSAQASEDDPRTLATNLVHAMYRVVKGCLLHDDTNQALVPLVESLVVATNHLCARVRSDGASVLFANNSVFVNRQMLRASRETYQLALELGTLLAGCNITEVTLEPGVEAATVQEFGRAVADKYRERRTNPKFAEGGWKHLRTRKVLGFGGVGEVLSPVTRVARTYAASIMIVRAFYADLRKGKMELSQGLKRIAQKLSGAPEDERRLLLTTAATPSADSDRSGIAVSSAIVATLMSAQLTDDRAAITNLAMAALLYDAARVRLARAGMEPGSSTVRNLSEDEEERLPSVAVTAMTTLGKLHPPSVTRTVIVHEALALRNVEKPPYGGARPPHLLSRILHIARMFAEYRVPRGVLPPLSIDDAVSVLTSQATDNTGRSLVKLLVGTLGVFPAGTMVELSTGELAVVTATPRLPVDFARPPVRIMYDASARLLETPLDIDLADQPVGGGLRLIRKTVDASDQQLKQMRAYVLTLSTGKRERPAAAAAEPPARPKRAPIEESPAQREVTNRPPPRRNISVAALPRIEMPSVEALPKVEALHEVEAIDVLPDVGSLPRVEAPRVEEQDNGPEIEVAPIPVVTRAPQSAPVSRRYDPRSDDDEPPPPVVEAVPTLTLSGPASRRLATWTGSNRRTPPAPAPPIEVAVVAAPPRSMSPVPAPQTIEGPPSRHARAAWTARSVPQSESRSGGSSDGSSTRQLAWQDLARRDDDSRAGVSAHDAILAAYLSEDGASNPPSRGSSPGLLDERDSRGDRHSGGLRWDRPSSLGVPSSGGPSTQDPSGPASRASGGLRWDSRPSAHPETSSTTVPPSSGSKRTEEAKQVEAPPESTVEGSASGRNKAGNQGWGTRRERK